jgi:hypothetical protein
MGIVDVACFTVGAALEFVTIISALSRANSAANSAGRSGRPSSGSLHGRWRRRKKIA